jgi:hypothetical protein
MSITGGVKFFDSSQCLAVNGAVISASSGDSTSLNVLDRNPQTKWRSSGSTDLVTETLTVTFDSAKTINRLFIQDHNWKDFSIQYDNGGTWTHFASVVGLDGSKANITETVFADDTAYYEFASVTTSALRIQVLKTQTANQEKYATQVIATSELGTLVGYPQISPIEIDRNSRVKQTQSGKYVIQKSDETVSFSLEFDNYPTATEYNADIDLVMTLHDRETPFLAWLCGGRRGTRYFRYTLRGFRLRDLFQMQITKALKLKYANSVYVNPIGASLVLEEAI